MSTTRRRWGKAGQRLTPRPAIDGIRRALAHQARERALDQAYRLWRAGGFVPAMATLALDAAGLYGPDVDRACGVEEPTVDLWEAGRVYPTWEQVLALARLTGRAPIVFFRRPLDWRETTMRFHVLEEAKPPVLACDPEAVRVVIVGAPERRPT